MLSLAVFTFSLLIDPSCQTVNIKQRWDFFSPQGFLCSFQSCHDLQFCSWVLYCMCKYIICTVCQLLSGKLMLFHNIQIQSYNEHRWHSRRVFNPLLPTCSKTIHSLSYQPRSSIILLGRRTSEQLFCSVINERFKSVFVHWHVTWNKMLAFFHRRCFGFSQ